MSEQSIPQNQKQAIPSAISRVSYYIASPVEACDRCSQGIKHVFPVFFKDGTSQKFGSECINKILSGDTSLQSLFKKNERTLKTYLSTLEILKLPFEEMPFDPKGYYNRGVYMVANRDGKMIYQNGHYLFHPTKIDDNFHHRQPNMCETLDMRPLASAWEEHTEANWKALGAFNIEQHKEWLSKEIARLEGFLGRIVQKGLATAAK